jgi:hypothetical protein
MSLIKDMLESKVASNELHTSLETEELPQFPAGDNPFRHDAYHMGTSIGKNVIIMYGGHSTDHQKYVIVCDITTGKRLRVYLG